MNFNIIIFFLLISIFIVVPVVAVFQVLEKIKRQRLEYRLKVISKQSSITKASHIAISQKRGPLPRMGLSRIVFFILFPLPAIYILFTASFFSSAIIWIAFYCATMGFLYYSFSTIRMRRYKKALIKDLPNSIDLVIRSLRAGRTITDSIKAVGDEGKGPVADQFRSIIDQTELGKDFIAVVNDISSKLHVPEFSFFVIVLSVQQETGGNIIKILGSLSNMLRQRELMRLKIRALSSEGIFSAFFMGSLPLIIVGLIELIRPEYLSILFTTRTGQYLLLCGIASEVLGCFIISRMVKIDV